MGFVYVEGQIADINCMFTPMGDGVYGLLLDFSACGGSMETVSVSAGVPYLVPLPLSISDICFTNSRQTEHVIYSPLIKVIHKIYNYPFVVTFVDSLKVRRTRQRSSSSRAPSSYKWLTRSSTSCAPTSRQTALSATCITKKWTPTKGQSIFMLSGQTFSQSCVNLSVNHAVNHYINHFVYRPIIHSIICCSVNHLLLSQSFSQSFR